MALTDVPMENTQHKLLQVVAMDLLQLHIRKGVGYY